MDQNSRGALDARGEAKALTDTVLHTEPDLLRLEEKPAHRGRPPSSRTGKPRLLGGMPAERAYTANKIGHAGSGGVLETKQFQAFFIIRLQFKFLLHPFTIQSVSKILTGQKHATVWRCLT
jgi:hypothetical protein